MNRPYIFCHMMTSLDGNFTHHSEPELNPNAPRVPEGDFVAAPDASMYEENIMSTQEFDSIFPRGKKNTAFGQYFIGQSYLNMLTTVGVTVGNVTFEPGCRNNWHIHHATKGGGQILLCTAGSGWYQAEGEAPVSLEPGSAVSIPANLKHWHGAKADSWFSHLAIEVPGQDTNNEWLEPVDDDHYSRLQQS